MSRDFAEVPWTIRDGDPQQYVGRSPLPADYSGFVHMWFGIAWVRLQGFERDGDAEAATRDWSDA